MPRLSERGSVPRLALSRTEVALSIGVSAGSVDTMVREGFLPAPRIWHTRKLWLVSEIEAALNEWPSDEGNTTHVRPWQSDRPGNAIPERESDPSQEHYDRIGLEPHTMDNSEYLRLSAVAHEKWKATVPGTPLNKLERRALTQLAQCELGKLVKFREIKGCGLGTAGRLEARGFIEIKFRPDNPERLLGYVLTKAGANAARQPIY